jgi:hypothetical protein
MYKQFYFLAALIFWAAISQSQEVPGAVETKKKGCSCAFSSIYNVGLVEGENGTSLQLQTGNFSTGKMRLSYMPMVVIILPGPGTRTKVST